MYSRTPVTSYRPVVTNDPCGGCPVTSYAPVTTYVQRPVVAGDDLSTGGELHARRARVLDVRFLSGLLKLCDRQLWRGADGNLLRPSTAIMLRRPVTTRLSYTPTTSYYAPAAARRYFSKTADAIPQACDQQLRRPQLMRHFGCVHPGVAHRCRNRGNDDDLLCTFDDLNDSAGTETYSYPPSNYPTTTYSQPVIPSPSTSSSTTTNYPTQTFITSGTPTSPRARVPAPRQRRRPRRQRGISVAGQHADADQKPAVPPTTPSQTPAKPIPDVPPEPTKSNSTSIPRLLEPWRQSGLDSGSCVHGHTRR